MTNFQENIVPATNQNRKDIFLSDKNGSPRVLFVGNSITRHGIKLDIGWDRECGMAASDIDHDYVHVFGHKFRETHPDASFGILQVANFERNFDKNFDLETYREVKEWKPDIIITFFGANVSKEYDKTENPDVKFGDMYEKLVDFLRSDSTKVFHSEGFYIRPVLDAEKKAVCERHGDVWIPLGDINSSAETHGLYNHPNDYGMELIANRFLEYVENKK